MPPASTPRARAVIGGPRTRAAGCRLRPSLAHASSSPEHRLCSKDSHRFASVVTKLPPESMILTEKRVCCCIGGNDAAGRNRSPHSCRDDVYPDRQCPRRHRGWCLSCRTSGCLVRAAVRLDDQCSSKDCRRTQSLARIRPSHAARAVLSVGISKCKNGARELLNALELSLREAISRREQILRGLHHQRRLADVEREVRPSRTACSARGWLPAIRASSL